jgi:hypothetical protein
VKILLPRLGADVHKEQVIGTEVPASSERPETARKGAAGDRRTDLRRQGIEKSFRVLLGTSREEAPEESIFSSATRLLDLFVRLGEQSGTREYSTQEGPRNIRPFGLLKEPRIFGSWLFRKMPGKASRRTSELSGHVVQ